MVEILRQRVENPLQRPVPAPLLEVAMAGLIRRITVRQVCPLGSGAQDPEHTVPDLAQILPRAATTILAPPVLRQQRRDQLPLGVREIHDTSPDAGGRSIAGRFTATGFGSLAARNVVSHF